MRGCGINARYFYSQRDYGWHWFKQAKADLQITRDCLKTGNYYASAFFSQQSLEKILKTWFLIEKEETPPKTHNLLDISLELNVPEEFLTIARE